MSDICDFEFEEEEEEEDYHLEPGESRGMSTPSKSGLVEIMEDVSGDRVSESSMASDFVYQDDDDDDDDDDMSKGEDDDGCDDGEEIKKKKLEEISEILVKRIDVHETRERLAKLKKKGKRSLYFTALHNSVERTTLNEEKTRGTVFSFKEAVNYPRDIDDKLVKTQDAYYRTAKTNYGRGLYSGTIDGRYINTDIKDAKEKDYNIEDAEEKIGDIKVAISRGDDIRFVNDRIIYIIDADEGENDNNDDEDRIDDSEDSKQGGNDVKNVLTRREQIEGHKERTDNTKGDDIKVVNAIGNDIKGVKARGDDNEDAEEKVDDRKDEEERVDDIKDAKEREDDIKDLTAEGGDTTKDETYRAVYILGDKDGGDSIYDDKRQNVSELILQTPNDTDVVSCECCFFHMFSRSKKPKKSNVSTKRRGLFYRLRRTLGLTKD